MNKETKSAQGSVCSGSSLTI